MVLDPVSTAVRRVHQVLLEVARSIPNLPDRLLLKASRILAPPFLNNLHALTFVGGTRELFLCVGAYKQPQKIGACMSLQNVARP